MSLEDFAPSNDPDITLDNFETRLNSYVKSFFEKWRLNNEDEPENWPLEMTEQDWMEQFLCDCSDG